MLKGSLLVFAFLTIALGFLAPHTPVKVDHRKAKRIFRKKYSKSR